MARCVLITGATGFIGCALMESLSSEAGFDVIGTSRNPGSTQGRGYRQFRIGERVSPELLSGIDVVVHCAHDFAEHMQNQNVSSAKQLREAFLAFNPDGLFVYVSSYSAREYAETAYGRVKFRCEQVLSEYPSIIIRPGFVLGGGGLFQRLAKLMKVFPVIPLFDGGAGKLPVIGIDRLCRVVARVIVRAHENEREYNLFERELVTQKVFFKAILQACGHKALLLSVPSAFCLSVLKAFESVGIKLPVGHENLKAFVANQDGVHFSNLAILESGDVSIRENVLVAFEDGSAQ